MRQERPRERIARIRAEEARRKRRRRWLGVSAGVVVVIAAVLGITLSLGRGGAKAKASGKLNLAPVSSLGALKAAPAAGGLGPEQVPVPSAATLASPAASVTGQKVDGIGCQTISTSGASR
jgi:hypothetical protein